MNIKSGRDKGIKIPFFEPSTCASGLQQAPIQPMATIKSKLKEQMSSKYAISSKLHYTRPIEALLGAKRDEGCIRFRYETDYLEKHEYLRRFYHKKESSDKIHQLCEYFKYHYEIPRIFVENLIDIIDSFHDRKRNKIYHQVKQLIGKENIVGDESQSSPVDRVLSSDQPMYSMLLKGLKPMKTSLAPVQPSKPDNDTVSQLARQLDQLLLSTVSGDLSSMSKLSTPRVNESLFVYREEKSKNDRLPVQKENNPSSLKKQRKPTFIQLNLDAIKPNSHITKYSTVTKITEGSTLEKKRSPRDGSNQKISVHIQSPLHANHRSSKETEKKRQQQQPKLGYDLQTIAKFRKDLEEFHLAQTLSNRKNPLFNSLKDTSNLPGNKSLSPKISLASSGRFGKDSMKLDSFKVLRTEPSATLFNRLSIVALKGKENKSQEKAAKVSSPSGKQPHSHKLSQQLASVRSAGQSADKEPSVSITKQLLAYNTRPRSKELTACKNDLKNSRSSMNNLLKSSSPREFILIKRLKSEERDEVPANIDQRTIAKIFDKKNSTAAKFNIIGKKDSSSTIHQSKPKDSKKAKPGSGVVQLTSFRSRNKMSSINLN